jgi:SPP1 gp7 family putative phage head morphogenesis protein
VVSFNAAPPRAFDFVSDDAKLNAFRAWLEQQIADGILEVVERGPQGQITDHGDFMDTYITAAYERGTQMANLHLERLGFTLPTPTFGFFSGPVATSQLAMLYTRSFELLKGITSDMSVKISRELTLGLAQGVGPREIARRLTKVVDLSIVRARTLARTEVIYSHAQASLDRYAAAGLEGVTIQAEWLSTKDKRTCPRCKAREGKVYSIKEARGLIPLHPQCRCSWIGLTADVVKARTQRKAA